MNEGLISQRYAKALYEYAATKQQEEALYHRMQLLSQHLLSIPHLKEILDNPMVSLNEKTNLLNEATGENPEQSYLDFVQLIVTNHREKSLQKIALSYQTLYRKKKNIRIVNLISAQKILPDILSRIRENVINLTHGTVHFSTLVDPTIGGGIIFQLDDYRLDASVKNQLERIRRQFVRKNKIIV